MTPYSTDGPPEWEQTACPWSKAVVPPTPYRLSHCQAYSRADSCCRVAYPGLGVESMGLQRAVRQTKRSSCEHNFTDAWI
jgi:hypothetical protein